MILDPTGLPGIAELHRGWREIRAELEANAHPAFQPWRERHIYRGDWDTLFLYDGYQRKTSQAVAETCALYPVTASLIANIPGVLSAGFSRLGPATRIVPHRGFDRHVARVHLGVKVPEGCWLATGMQRWFWREGDIFAFDDSGVHMVENGTAEDRIILVVDVDIGISPNRLLPHRAVKFRLTHAIGCCLMHLEFWSRCLARKLRKFLR